MSDASILSGFDDSEGPWKEGQTSCRAIGPAFDEHLRGIVGIPPHQGSSDDNLVCTRPVGHAGDHIAHFAVVGEGWPTTTTIIALARWPCEPR